MTEEEFKKAYAFYKKRLETLCVRVTFPIPILLILMLIFCYDDNLPPEYMKPEYRGWLVLLFAWLLPGIGILYFRVPVYLKEAGIVCPQCQALPRWFLDYEGSRQGGIGHLYPICKNCRTPIFSEKWIEKKYWFG